MAFRLLATLFLVGLSVAYSLNDLTAETYDKITEGKTVFLKFYAPTVRLGGSDPANCSLFLYREARFKAL
jgi:hypothetical protein